VQTLIGDLVKLKINIVSCVKGFISFISYIMLSGFMQTILDQFGSLYHALIIELAESLRNLILLSLGHGP